MNMSLISGANTNVTFHIQVRVHLTGKCLLRYIEVVFHYMETDLYTFFCQGKCSCIFIPTLYNLFSFAAYLLVIGGSASDKKGEE